MKKTSRKTLSRKAIEQGYVECRSRYSIEGVLCELCKKVPAKHRHHIDENPTNNIHSNVSLLCNQCHRKVHTPTYKGDVTSSQIIDLRQAAWKSGFTYRELCKRARNSGMGAKWPVSTSAFGRMLLDSYHRPMRFKEWKAWINLLSILAKNKTAFQESSL